MLRSCSDSTEKKGCGCGSRHRRMEKLDHEHIELRGSLPRGLAGLHHLASSVAHARGRSTDLLRDDVPLLLERAQLGPGGAQVDELGDVAVPKGFKLGLGRGALPDALLPLTYRWDLHDIFTH
ncbi:hypothetical protein ZWY2020_013684 [Hordeum vulgare]|nr:hypothetical protein ZWY2020_013684 [Hordeum vulgare]